MQRLTCSLFVFVLTLCAQSTSSISGVVTNSLTGAPVRQAFVRLFELGSGASSVSALTNDSGSFLFPNLPPSDYFLRLTKLGYASPDQMEVRLRPEPQNLNLTMTPLAVIKGRVVDQYGDPVSGLVMQALQRDFYEGRRSFRSWFGSRTNDRGEYVIPSLVSDSYLVKIAGRPSVNAQTSGAVSGFPSDEAFAPIYYPSATASEEATQFKLAPGSVVEVNFTLPLLPGWTASGRVLNRSENTGFYTELLSKEENLESNRVVSSASTGEFMVRDLLDGSYTLRVTQGQAEFRRRGLQKFKVSGNDVRNLNIHLYPGVNIRGQVTPPGLDAEITLIVLEDGLWRRAERFTGRSVNGGFDIPNVLPGRYRIEVRASRGFVTAVAAGTVRLPYPMEMEVVGGAPVPELNISIGTHAGFVRGTLPSGHAGNVTVLLVPTDAYNASGSKSVKGRDGQFFIAGIPPGDYRLHVWRGEDVPAFADLNVMRKLAASGITVTVTPSEVQTVALAEFSAIP